MHASIRHLRMFMALAQSHSVTEAAALCHVSQPAVSQAMQNLSQQAGLDLFLRTQQGIFLSEAGQILLRRATRALGLLDAAMAEMSPDIRVQASWAQLQALIAVCEFENFTLAARHLGLSQPTVHRSAGGLEQSAKTRFFERSPHGLSATRAARDLAQAARLAMAELDQAEAELAASAGRELGQIVIGALPLMRSGLLPRAILAFQAQRPRIEIVVMDGSYDELLGALRCGEIDAMVGALRLPSPINDIRQEALFDDTAVIVARRDHPLTKRGRIGPEDLAAYPWVLPRRSAPIRAVIDGLLAGQSVRAAVESSSVIMLRELLCGSDYLGTLAAAQAMTAAEAEVLAILDVEVPQSLRPIGITTRLDWEPTEAQRDLLWEIRRACAQKA